MENNRQDEKRATLLSALKKKHIVWVSLVSLVAIGLLTATLPTEQAATTSVTLAFESQALDLDSGSVVEEAIGPIPDESGADIRVGYHADRAPHATVLPAAEGVELAFLGGVTFDEISAASLSGLTFSAVPVDLPFDMYNSLVIRTKSGAVFKIGNAWESDVSVTFDYEQLQ